MGQPALVLADEPTAALVDEPPGREVMALLAELTTTQRTATIVVTHAPHQLTQATRTLRLENGTLVAADAEARSTS